MCTDIEISDRARRYKGLLSWSETSAFNTYVDNKLLIDCKIDVEDIDRDDHIYG